MAIKLAKFKDVANGTQAGQFGVGEYGSLSSLNDLDPIYRQLLWRHLNELFHEKTCCQPVD